MKKSFSLLCSFCFTILLFSSCKTDSPSSLSTVSLPESVESISYPNTIAISDDLSITFLTDILSYLTPSSTTTTYKGLSPSTLTEDYLYFMNYENYESDEDFISSVFRYNRSTQTNEKLLDASDGNFIQSFAIFENDTLFIQEEKKYDGQLYTYTPSTYYYYNLSTKEKTPLSDQIQATFDDSFSIYNVYDKGFILYTITGELGETSTYYYVENNEIVYEFSFTDKSHIYKGDNLDENYEDQIISTPFFFTYQDTIFFYDGEQNLILLMNPRLEEPVPAFSYSGEGFDGLFFYGGFSLDNIQEDFFLSILGFSTQKIVNLTNQTFVGQNDDLSFYFFNSELTNNGFFVIPRNYEQPAEDELDYNALPYALYNWDGEPIEFYERNGTIPEIHTISIDEKNIATGIGYTDEYHTQAVPITLNPIPQESVSQDMKDLFASFKEPYDPEQEGDVETALPSLSLPDGIGSITFKQDLAPILLSATNTNTFYYREESVRPFGKYIYSRAAPLSLKMTAFIDILLKPEKLKKFSIFLIMEINTLIQFIIIIIILC